MSLPVIIMTVIIIIGFIIWYVRIIAERDRINLISEEKKRGENLRLEERKRLRTEERISKNQEERKLREEQNANADSLREEKDSKERELRQKIEDRKKHEAVEEQRKAENKKIE